MAVVEQIRERLVAAFSPQELDVIDESEKHHGHGGWREEGETHFRVRMRAAELAPRTRLERHRLVHAALGQELVARIHALALDLDG